MKKSIDIGYIAVVLILLFACIFSLKLFLRQRVERDLLNINTFPYEFDDWKSTDIELSEREYEILETHNILVREYKNSKEEKIMLFIIYSETNRSVIHPPEICLMGSRINITDKKKEYMEFKDKKFWTNKIYTEKKNQKQLMLYSYKAGNFYTDNYYLQQVYFAYNQLFREQKGIATVRVSMLINDNEEAAFNSLKNFMKKTIDIMENL